MGGLKQLIKCKGGGLKGGLGFVWCLRVVSASQTTNRGHPDQKIHPRTPAINKGSCESADEGVNAPLCSPFTGLLYKKLNSWNSATCLAT